MDIITSNLVDEMNSDLIQTSSSMDVCTINIGSVFVSGQKEKESQFGAIKDGQNVTLHFFVHPDSLSKVGALFNWPNNDWMNNNLLQSQNDFEYERVGRTHIISKYGWKYFPIPRYTSGQRSFLLSVAQKFI